MCHIRSQKLLIKKNRILKDDRGQKPKNRTRAAFLKKIIVYSKTAFLCLFWAFFALKKYLLKKDPCEILLKFAQNVEIISPYNLA